MECCRAGGWPQGHGVVTSVSNLNDIKTPISVHQPLSKRGFVLASATSIRHLKVSYDDPPQRRTTRSDRIGAAFPSSLSCHVLHASRAGDEVPFFESSLLYL